MRSVSPVESLIPASVCRGKERTIVVFHMDSSRVIESLRDNDDVPILFLASRNHSVVQSLKSELDGFPGLAGVLHGHGFSALPSNIVADQVIIRLPHEKASFHQLLAEVFDRLKPGANCLVYGGNNEGIKPAASLMKKIFGNCEVVGRSAGHRILKSVIGSNALDRDVLTNLCRPVSILASAQRHAVCIDGREITFFTRPGVFSWDGIDAATHLLGTTMSVREGDRVLDLGCGSGVLTAIASSLAQGCQFTLTDSDSEALKCAQDTMVANSVVNWRVVAGDVADTLLDDSFDLVICNPPFHSGKLTDLSLPVRFMERAKSLLSSSGRFQMVANRSLPYEKELERIFGNRRTVIEAGGFKVLEAINSL